MQSVVYASLFYGLEHCALGARDRRCLDGYFLRLAKRVLQLRYDYHLSYEEAEQRLGVERPSQLARNRLRWIGHAFRSEDIVLSEVLTFVPQGGARRRGRPRLRFYDTLKADLAEEWNIVLPAHNQNEFWRLLQEKTVDRTNWQKIVKWRR